MVNRVFIPKGCRAPLQGLATLLGKLKFMGKLKFSHPSGYYNVADARYSAHISAHLSPSTPAETMPPA